MTDIKFNTRISQRVDVEISLEQIIEHLNSLNIKHRWNHIAGLLNGIDLGDSIMLDETQRKMICDYLKSKLSMFENSKLSK